MDQRFPLRFQTAAFFQHKCVAALVFDFQNLEYRHLDLPCHYPVKIALEVASLGFLSHCRLDSAVVLVVAADRP